MKTKHIRQIVTSIAASMKDEDIQNYLSNSQSEIESEINYILENRDRVIEILNILFPQGILVNVDFYTKILDIKHFLGYKETTKSLIGLLWVEGYKLLPNHDAYRLLNVLGEDKNIDFWPLIHSLPIFLSEIEVPSDFATTWFCSIGKRVGGDLAGGDFYKAIENYGFNFPESGLKVLEKYLSEGLDDLKLHLSAILLGALRASLEMGRIQKEVIEELDRKLVNDIHLEFRLCYHRSWVIPFWRNMLSIEQLELHLTKMMQGTPEEITEAFNVLYMCLLSQLTNKTFVEFSMLWFKNNASSLIPLVAKNYIIDSMYRLCDVHRTENRLVNVLEASKLIISVQPIPKENTGIWSNIEYYLVDRLREDKELFKDFINQFIEANPDGLLEQFNDNFGYLKSEMVKSDVSRLSGELLFSSDKEKRRLGNILFKEIKINSLPDEIVENVDESQLSMALWEFVRSPLLGSDTSRFFLMLEPLFRNVSPELQEEFTHEMVMQAINYPEGCLENWGRINNPSDLLKSVIGSAKKYFENLKKVHNSPANSFSFPGLIQAAEKANREFSRKISEDVKEKSIFAKLIKNVEIIYGSQWSVAVQGSIGEPTSFKEVSHSMEFPRLELIDPEGMIKRRVHATNKIIHSENAGHAD